MLTNPNRAPPPRVRVAAAGLMLGAAALACAPSDALACTQVWVPDAFTQTGDRYVGRSEDYASRHVKIFGVQEPVAGKVYESEESDFHMKSRLPKTYRYTYVRDHPSDWDGSHFSYSEAGINEHGVSCSATLTTNASDEILAVDPLCDFDNPNGETGGIGEFNYADVILGENKTAREAVILLGEVLDEHGTSGNDQITISDTDESWLFCALSGHQWIAFQLPADQVSVNPNMGNLLFDVDLDDSETCLHSKDLLELPRQHGLLETYEDGAPNIAGTYGRPDDGQGVGQMTRYVQGRHYFGASLAQELYDLDASRGGVTRLDSPALFFTPGTKDMDTAFILRSLAARGEGTDVDANAHAGFYAIGNNRTVESHMFQIREELPDDIATVQWEALSRAEFSVFVPLYSALITEPSPYFSNLDCDESHQGPDQSDDVAFALQEEPEDSLPFILMDINTLAYNHRDSMASGTRAYLDALQNQIIEQHALVDAVMRQTPAEQRAELADKAQDTVVEQTYRKCDALLDEMRAYVKAGDFDAPFSPSDLAQSGDLQAPLTYAATFVAPSIAKQPADATYEQGAEAADLSVEADGNATGQLSYEWFVAGETPTSTGIKAASMPVSTDAVGTTGYFCRVTNAAGLSCDSAVATITVTEPARKPEPPKKEEGGKPQTGNKPKPGDLPQTGDPASMTVLGMLTAGGIGALGYGASRRRKTR